MHGTVPTTKDGTWNYENEIYGGKDQFPKIFSDFRQGSESHMSTGVRGES